jgi:hypothetical protein
MRATRFRETGWSLFDLDFRTLLSWLMPANCLLVFVFPFSVFLFLRIA